MFRAIVNASDRQEVSEPAVCALRHITARFVVYFFCLKKKTRHFRHEQASLANQKVREAAGNQGLNIIMKYLHPGQAKYALRKVCHILYTYINILNHLGRIGVVAKFNNE